MDFDSLPIPIDAHPDAAQQLGRLVASWSVIELLVTALFARVIGDRGPIAAAILHQFQHIHHRLDVVNGVIDEKISDVTRRENLKALTGEVRRLSKERNRLVHGLWGVTRSGSLIVCEGTTVKRKRIDRPVAVSEIEHLVNEIVALRTRLRSVILPPGPKPLDFGRLIERQSP